MQEIERKFIVDEDKFNSFLLDLPEDSSLNRVMIQQYYFNCNGGTFRIRFIDSKAMVCLKEFISSGINNEVEKEIDIKTASEIVNAVTNKTSIRKTRFIFHINNIKWEVDVFVEPEIIIAEVELPKIDYKIEIPFFCIEEVTGKKEYSNEALAASIEVPQIN